MVFRLLCDFRPLIFERILTRRMRTILFCGPWQGPCRLLNSRWWLCPGRQCHDPFCYYCYRCSETPLRSETQVAEKLAGGIHYCVWELVAYLSLPEWRRLYYETIGPLLAPGFFCLENSRISETLCLGINPFILKFLLSLEKKLQWKLLKFRKFPEFNENGWLIKASLTLFLSFFMSLLRSSFLSTTLLDSLARFRSLRSSSSWKSNWQNSISEFMSFPFNDLNVQLNLNLS